MQSRRYAEAQVAWRRYLAAIEPAWLANSDLGYILWGMLAAGLGAVVGGALGASDQSGATKR